MRRKLSIQLKAGFMLLVFSLNTAVGFACAVGVDMGFNKTHHENTNTTEVTEIHVHKNGANHHHSSSSDNQPAHKHEGSTAHDHADNVPVNQEKDGKDESGCCSNEVLKFQSLDKNLNQTTNNTIDSQVFFAILSSFFRVDLIPLTKEIPTKFKARFYYPPPADILIAIQRFQI